MLKYSHLFFDLDHTLWDYDTNARKVLINLYSAFDLSRMIRYNTEQFLKIYFKTNDGLWHDYNQGRISKETIRNHRFNLVLTNCGCTDLTRCPDMNAYFLYHCPRQKEVMPEALSTLDYLSTKYEMSIITNGFDDAQAVKLKASGLDQYFRYVFTSETIGVKKPAPEIFEYALNKVKVHKEEALMIGDNPKTDILGAQNAGITPLLYNPEGRIKSECQLQIKHLTELIALL